MSQQVAHIEKCFGDLYCKVQGMQCVGKNTTKEELLLDKLYIAYWISCGSDCDIECFLMKNCAHCKPTKNTLPPVQPSCCGIDKWLYIDGEVNPGVVVSNYESLNADISFESALSYTVISENAGTLSYELEVTSETGALLYSTSNYPATIPTLSATGVNEAGLIIFYLIVSYVVNSSKGLVASNRVVYHVSYNPMTEEATSDILSVGPIVYRGGNCIEEEWGNDQRKDEIKTTIIMSEPPVIVDGSELIVEEGPKQIASIKSISPYKKGGDPQMYGTFWANCSG